jgi:hypothetical protein
MSVKYTAAITDNGWESVEFVLDGQQHFVPAGAATFDRLVHALVTGGDPSPFLSEETVVEVATLDFAAVDARVTLVDGKVFFNGEETHTSLAQAIVRYWSEGRDYGGLVRFMERLALNPSENSRNELWTWVERQGLAVDKDGRFLGFKAVNHRTAGDEFPYESQGSGTAFVDGVKFVGRIPNKVGAVLTMPRKDVDENSRVDCSNGLHVGTHGYATSFGPPVLLEVAVAPEDVVSVPLYDHNKLRCARYEVIAVSENKVNDLTQHEAPAEVLDNDQIEELLLNEDVPQSFLDKVLPWRKGKGKA